MEVIYCVFYVGIVYLEAGNIVGSVGIGGGRRSFVVVVVFFLVF